MWLSSLLLMFFFFFSFYLFHSSPQLAERIQQHARPGDAFSRQLWRWILNPAAKLHHVLQWLTLVAKGGLQVKKSLSAAPQRPAPVVHSHGSVALYNRSPKGETHTQPNTSHSQHVAAFLKTMHLCNFISIALHVLKDETNNDSTKSGGQDRLNDSNGPKVLIFMLMLAIKMSFFPILSWGGWFWTQIKPVNLPLGSLF